MSNASAGQSPYQLLPDLSATEFEALKQDIAGHGVLVPIERDEHGNLLDGHHRIRAVQELRAEGLAVADPPVIVRLGYTEQQKRSHVRSLNLCRRQLTQAQRRVIIEQQLQDTPGRSDRAIAHALSVSPTTVGMVRRRLGGHGVTVQIGQSRIGRDGRSRRVPVSRTIMAPDGAYARRAIAALSTVPPEALPDRIITSSDAAVAARIIHREARREERFKRLRDPGSLRGLGKGRYVVLLVDPPWSYSGASDPTRKAEEHYPTMTHDQLLKLPVGDIAARSAVMFLWAGAPKLGEAIELITAWGFTYKTSAVWCKRTMGLGSYFRIGHELLLVASRGSLPPPAPENRQGSIIDAPRGEHSAKPAIVRQYIEAMYPECPRIELFARGCSPGWDGWGMEAHTAASDP